MAYGEMDWSEVISGSKTITSRDLDLLLDTVQGAKGFQSFVDKQFPKGTYLELFYKQPISISNRNVCDIIDIIKENQAYARIVNPDTKKTTVEGYKKRVGTIAEIQQKINTKKLEAEKEAQRQREAEAPKNQQPAAQKQELMTKEQKVAEDKFNAEKQEAPEAQRQEAPEAQKQVYELPPQATRVTALSVDDSNEPIKMTFWQNIAAKIKSFVSSIIGATPPTKPQNTQNHSPVKTPEVSSSGASNNLVHRGQSDAIRTKLQEHQNSSNHHSTPVVGAMRKTNGPTNRR